MKETWPDERSRSNFIKYLEYELLISECASKGTIDSELLEEFSGFLSIMFPLTNAYILEKTKDPEAKVSVDDIKAVAWAEARSSRKENGKTGVQGDWTRSEILEDIEECLAIARKNAKP